MFSIRRLVGASKTPSKLVNQNIRAFSAQMQLKQPTVDIDYTKLFIGGKFVDSISGKTMPTVDPRTGEAFAHVAEAQKEDIDIAIASARDAFDNGIWPRMSGGERGKILNKLADLINENSETLKQLETWDNGKPLTASHGDILLTEDLFRYYAGWSDKINGKTIPCNNLGGIKKFAYTLHEPIGVVGSIVPWNFPLYLMALQVAPSLATGNTIIIKAAETSPLTALYFAQLCSQAGIPNGVINITPGYGPTAGQALASSPNIDKITFTGETITGKLVMKAASKNITPITLELGGKSPYIVFNDADLDLAVNTAQIGLFLNQGQCCCASTRIYVQEDIYDKFIEKTINITSQRKVGDPFTDVDQGPQQNEEVFNKIIEYIKIGKKEGAKLLYGGNRIGDKGYFIEPTIFGDVKDDMKISRNEIFGPVMQVDKFKDIDEAIARANDTSYGLAAGICSSNINTCNRVSREIKAGTIWINCYDIFDSSLPFGGYKNSGIGRTKGEYALENFTQIKSVVQSLPNDGGWY